MVTFIDRREGGATAANSMHQRSSTLRTPRKHVYLQVPAMFDSEAWDEWVIKHL
jgi:hypothetical protein